VLATTSIQGRRVRELFGKKRKAGQRGAKGKVVTGSICG
jgi:hypothetical protein